MKRQKKKGNVEFTKKDMFGVLLILFTLIAVLISHAKNAPGQLSPWFAIILFPALVWGIYFEFKIFGNWKRAS